MTYQVTWSEKARKNLQELDKKVTNRIIAKVESIKERPLDYTKRLVGLPLYSLRVGDYRVIMDIKSKQMLIFIVKVGPRKSVYDKL